MTGDPKDRRRDASAVDDAPARAGGEASGLARWSRRKAMARASKAPVPPTRDPADTSTTADVAPAKTDADMPPIESLHEDSDYAAFLSPQVSEKLRRLALRKLFHLPQFNFRDGLDDYAEDYRSFAPLGDVVTADMRHHMERELQALKERLQAGTGAGPDNETTAETAAVGDSAAGSAGDADPPSAPQAAADASEPEPRRPSKG